MSEDEYEQRYMDPGEHVLFREKVVSHTAFRVSIAFAVIFGLPGLAVLGAAVVGAIPAAPGMLFGALPFVFGALMGVLGVMFSVFRVMVTGSHVHVHFGWAKRKIPRAAISTVRVIDQQGFRQGKVSVGFDGVVRTWVGNSKSGRAVEITYQEEGKRKNVITIGSEDPERFASTIESARIATRIKADDNEDAAAMEEEASSTEASEELGERREVR